MLQFRDFLVSTIGDQAMKLGFFFIFLLLLLNYAHYIILTGLPAYRIRQSIYVFALATVLILLQTYFAERLHVIEYGLLGYLALRDFSGKGLRGTISDCIKPALLFVLWVSMLDEGFQWILPYRTGDIRDVITNMASGFLGVIQFSIFRGRN
ncbi:MAG: VanZ family protein [Candidatus Omnitrophica bacterium]|nr:VanZ family protein [Candidatus Omnitrophota bacterium]